MSTAIHRTAVAILVTVLIVSLPVSGAVAGTDSSARGEKGTTAVITADQQEQKVLVFDTRFPNWRGDGRMLLWSWYPHVGNGFSDDPAPGWSNVDEAKLRDVPGTDDQVVLTTASGGFLGMVDYPSGERLWSVNVQEDPDDGFHNPHSIELLPDGNIAAAASTGGWLRLYTASQGPDAETYIEYPLVGGHGVQWDPELELLWALGDDELIAFEVGGTPADPTLEVERISYLPTFGGHDLQPVYGDTDRLWVTSNTGVYQYVKSIDEWDTDYPMADELYRTMVKSVSNHPVTDQVVQAKPKADCATTWCTDTIDFFGPAETRMRKGAEFYKARWFVPDYQ